MRSVGIADLKSRLSEHLRTVKRGQVLEVMDRDTPIARIVPIDRSPGGLVVRSPKPNSPRPGNIVPPKRRRLKVDILELLREERADR